MRSRLKAPEENTMKNTITNKIKKQNKAYLDLVVELEVLSRTNLPADGINDWYMTANHSFEGQTPREVFLSGEKGVKRLVKHFKGLSK
jgi:hypothetical protein